MSNRLDDVLRQQEHFSSRRQLLKWVGQVAGGASIAATAIGLGLTNIPNALAAPDCTPCPTGCSFQSCVIDSGYCGIQNEYKTTFREYQGGCVGQGQSCPYTTKTVCASSCSHC